MARKSSLFPAGTRPVTSRNEFEAWALEYLFLKPPYDAILRPLTHVLVVVQVFGGYMTIDVVRPHSHWVMIPADGKDAIEMGSDPAYLLWLATEQRFVQAEYPADNEDVARAIFYVTRDRVYTPEVATIHQNVRIIRHFSPDAAYDGFENVSKELHLRQYIGSTERWGGKVFPNRETITPLTRA